MCGGGGAPARACVRCVRAPRFGYAELQSLAGGTGRVSESLFRVRRNLESCAAMNADMETRYYDDAQVEAARASCLTRPRQV